MNLGRVYIVISVLAIVLFSFWLTKFVGTNVEKDDYQTLFLKIAKDTKSKGPSPVFSNIQKGFNSGKYDVNKCHNLLHALGHAAYEYFGNDFESYGISDYKMCFEGFQHGVEAQIALQKSADDTDLKHTLNAFCDYLKSIRPEAECFHGAGHAFIQSGIGVLPSLQKCDIVETSGYTDCYRGAFSERVNRIMGIDGDTDSKIAGVTPENIDKDNVFKECFGYPFKYRGACITQFTILIPDTEGLEKMINTCLRYVDYVEDICVPKISGNLASFLIGENKDVPVPDNFNSLRPRIRRLYIEGVIDQYSQYPETPKRLEFCSKLENSADKNYCLNLKG